MFDINSLSQPVFTWQTAMSLALASDLVYQSGTAVTNVCRNRWGLDVCEFLANSDTECFVASTASAVVVAFRGTESLNDWLADLDVLSTTRTYGTVHRGFVNAFEAIRPQLTAALDAQAVGGKRVLLTGHSLGGALATIACCELRGRYDIRGIYTFGQPRLADDVAANFVNVNYSNRFYRFVFDDDIVTRIPPGYRHVGRLYHFDADGFLPDNLSEASGAPAEPPPLSEAEFAALQETAQELKVASNLAAGGLDESADVLADRSMEGLIPSISDHRMTRYISAIRNQLPRAAEEMNESLLLAPVVALEAVRTIGLEGMGAAPRTLFPVQVRARHRDWRPPAGAQLESKVGAIYSLLATGNELAALQHDPGVASINISREIDLDIATECGRSMPFVQADPVHTGQLNEKGDQCIVAIIDTGVDILHEAFLDATGQNTRIDAVWVQRDLAGPSPNQVDPATFLQGRGRLYQHDEIQAFVNNDLINGNHTTPGVLRDPHGHGTHVASIAAGRPVGTFYGGLAPEARIVVVIPDLKTAPGNPVSLGYSVSHQSALEFLLAYKRKHALPMAVNLSQGMNAGAHDGETKLEKVFDSITTKGSEPGMVIVKSGGNENGFSGHAQLQPAQVGTESIKWSSVADLRTDDYFEFWYHRDDELRFKLTDPAGQVSPAVDHSSKDCTWPTNGNSVLMRLTVNHADNSDNLLVVQVFRDQQPIQAGTWQLEVEGVAVTGDHWLHGWVERNDQRPVRFTAGATNDMTLSIPGTAETVISVAASNVPPPAAPVALQAFSSRGPTRRNGPKPDLCAPGDAIVAASSNQNDHQAVRAESGTSMAAPHVTGAMALVMSARHKKSQADINKPQFNALQLGRMVRQSAKGYTGQHHRGFGYGGLNVLSFFTKADLA